MRRAAGNPGAGVSPGFLGPTISQGDGQHQVHFHREET